MQSISINHESRKPKYQQVVDSILGNISSGRLVYGQRIPSINELSEYHLLSRDTVERAYVILKDRKIISSVKGKGYYVTNTDTDIKKKILFLVNKLSNYKLRTFNSFVNVLGHHAKVDLDIYHCESELFSKILIQKHPEYDFVVVMPHFKNENQNYCSLTQEALTALKTVPKQKLLLLDNYIENAFPFMGAVYQDFANDQFEALTKKIKRIKNYKKLILVFSHQSIYPYPTAIASSFESFCKMNNIQYEILPEIYDGMELKQKDLYITIEENDLVCLFNQVRVSKLEIGKDIGIISYNDTPLKELLGISVLTTNFRKMGATAAQMILDNRFEVVRNQFDFITRASIS